MTSADRIAHAAERVGFLYARLTAGDQLLVVMTSYVPVADKQYVVDETVGARVNGDAIRAAMQGVIDTGQGVFHTHLHEWPGRPAFSPTDNRELPRLIPAFRAVGPAQARPACSCSAPTRQSPTSGFPGRRT